MGRPRTILRKLWKASGKVVKPVTCWRSPSSGWNGPALVLTYSAVAGSNLGEPWHPEHSDEPKRWQLRLSGNCVGDQTDTFLGPHTQLFVFPTCSVVSYCPQGKIPANNQSSQFLLANLPVPAIVLLRIIMGSLMGSADLSPTESSEIDENHTSIKLAPRQCCSQS